MHHIHKFSFYHQLFIENLYHWTTNPKNVFLTLNRLLIKLQEKRDTSSQEHYIIANQLFERFMKLFKLKHKTISIIKSRSIGKYVSV